MPLMENPMLDWQCYQDPDGYFSIWVPSSWTVQRITGQGKAGFKNTDQAIIFPTIKVLFGEAPLDGKHILVSVSIAGTTNPLHRQTLTCPPANTTLANLPAYHKDDLWILDTPQAHIEISYRIPGIAPSGPGGAYQPYSIEPQPPHASEVIASSKRMVDQMIASFQPQQC